MREYYGYALIAGLPPETAADLTPGFILDMYVIRMKYDAKLAGAKMERRALGG